MICPVSDWRTCHIFSEEAKGLFQADATTYRNIDPETADRLGRNTEIEGVLITDVDQGSEAFREANLASRVRTLAGRPGTLARV